MFPGPTVPSPLRTSRRRCLVYCGIAALSFATAGIITTHPEFRLSSPTFPTHRISASPVGVQPKLQASYGKLPLSFEINRGQSDAQVQFPQCGSEFPLHHQHGVHSDAFSKGGQS
jgi:hypothetical protein